MSKEKRNEPEAELWETPIYNGWAKKLDHRESYKSNVKKYRESDFTQLAK